MKIQKNSENYQNSVLNILKVERVLPYSKLSPQYILCENIGSAKKEKLAAFLRHFTFSFQFKADLGC